MMMMILTLSRAARVVMHCHFFTLLIYLSIFFILVSVIKKRSDMETSINSDVYNADSDFVNHGSPGRERSFPDKLRPLHPIPVSSQWPEQRQHAASSSELIATPSPKETNNNNNHTSSANRVAEFQPRTKAPPPSVACLPLMDPHE